MDEQTQVSSTGEEPEIEKKRIEPIKPCTQCLFEFVKSLIELANVLGMMRIFKAQGLLHIYGFRQKTMKKGVLYIQLANILSLNHSNGED
jgi:hypothetical protein